MIYPTTPELQKQWVEDSIASRLADLKHQATKNERDNRRKEFVK